MYINSNFFLFYFHYITIDLVFPIFLIESSLKLKPFPLLFLPDSGKSGSWTVILLTVKLPTSTDSPILTPSSQFFVNITHLFPYIDLSIY